MHAIGLKLEMCAKIMRMSHPVSRSPYPYLLAVFCAVFLISNITAQ